MRFRMGAKELTVPELAKRLGCSIPRAQALIRTGTIGGRKGTSGWLTTPAAVEAYLAKRANPPRKPAPKRKSASADFGTHRT